MAWLLHLGVLRDGATVRDDTCVVMFLVSCPTYSFDTVIYSSKTTQEMEEFIWLTDYNPSSREDQHRSSRQGPRGRN